MSAKKEHLTPHYGSVSFASFDDKATFSNIHLNSRQNQAHRTLLEESKYRYMHDYQNDRENVAPNIHPGLVSPLAALGQVHTIELLEMENKRLQEVIFYVGTNNDKLLAQCEEQQKQITSLKTTIKKEKEQYETQMKKMKEIVNDKKSECESISKNSKRQIQMVQQENERIKNHIKSIIEKKNDDIFNITRNKEVQIADAKKQLERTIEEIKEQNRKEVDQLNGQIERLEEEIEYWKGRYSQLETEYRTLDENTQSEKLNLLSEYEATFNGLKQKYHRNKLLMLEASQQQVQTLEQSSELLRDTYLTQIDNLKQHIQILNHENKELLEQEENARNFYEDSLKGYQKIIEELRNKNSKLCVMRQQQLQLLKIRTSALHQSNLKSVQNIYSPKIKFLTDKINSFEDQVQKLHEVLAKQIDKNSDLVRKARIQQSKHQQDLKRMKMMYDNSQTMMKQQFLTQKSLIMQQSARMIKNYELKANNAKFSQQQLRKLRIMLDQRIKQNDINQKGFEQERNKWQTERETLLTNIKNVKQSLSKQIQGLKKDIKEKTKQCEKLRQQILKNIRESPLPDYNKYIQEIQQLKKDIAQKNELQKQMKDKVENAERRCRQYKQQSQKINLQNEVIINEAKGQWQIISQKKLQDLQDFYKKKLDYAQTEKQQLNHAYQELQNKMTSVVERYKQLESALSETMIALEKRSQLQRKVIMLGTDNNLVKNKQQLFEY